MSKQSQNDAMDSFLRELFPTPQDKFAKALGEAVVTIITIGVTVAVARISQRPKETESEKIVRLVDARMSEILKSQKQPK